MPVVGASLLQILLAVTFLIMPAIAYPYGASAQVFDVRYLTSAFRKSGDQALRSINVKAFVDAAVRAFPAGFRSLVAARFVLTTAGSVLVIVLLAVPAANAYFH
jgi:hypothetical protein